MDNHRKLWEETAVLLLAATVRIWGLGARSLWFDESIEYWMAVVPLGEIHRAIAAATHDPPLYSYLLHGWLQLGIQELWLRLPSFYFSLFAVVGVVSLARLWFDKKAALLAGLFLALSAADVRYAQEVGQYSLMVCLAVWNIIFLTRAAQRNRWRDWLAWGGIALVSVYTHYGSAILLLSVALPVLLSLGVRRRWRAVWRQVAVGTAVALALLPLVLIIIPQQLGRLGAAPLPVGLNQLLQTSSQMLAFFVVGNEGIISWPYDGMPFWLAWLPLLVLLGVALLWTRSPLQPTALLLAAWLGYYLISRTGAYFFAPTRHALLLLPLLAVSVGWGAAALDRAARGLGTGLLVAILLFSVTFPREGEEDLRGATAYWLEHRRGEEGTFVYYGAVPGFRFQLDAQTTPHGGLPPVWYGDCYAAAQRPYCNEFGIFFSPWARGFSEDAYSTLFAKQMPRGSKAVWLLFSHVHEDEAEAVLGGARTAYEIERHVSFEGAAVYKLKAKKLD